MGEGQVVTVQALKAGWGVFLPYHPALQPWVGFGFLHYLPPFTEALVSFSEPASILVAFILKLDTS
jgi:hypothetical protein